MNYYEQVESLIKNNEINKKVRALQDNGETLYTYWNIGRLIVEAQSGEKRAKYGDGLIKEWGYKLSEKFGKKYEILSLFICCIFFTLRNQRPNSFLLPRDCCWWNDCIGCGAVVFCYLFYQQNSKVQSVAWRWIL